MSDSHKFSREELEAMVRAVPSWWHSIDLGQGVVTPGDKSATVLAREWAALQLPDLRGKTVLDIGAFDGFFSFEAERRGAARVVALDYTTWCLDIPGYWGTYVEACRRRGEVPAQPDQTPFWRPTALPGKRGFDTAHRALGSAAESRVADFMAMPLDESFDIVLYLGVLYHMKDPLGSLERLDVVTKELAVIETECVGVPGHESALCEFFESDELTGDVTNWWVPNERALLGLCRAAGFKRVELATTAPWRAPRERLCSSRQLVNVALSPLLRKIGIAWHPSDPTVHRYRATVRAWK